MEYLFPFAENNSQNRHCLTGKPHKQGVFSHFLTIPKGEGNTNFSFLWRKIRNEINGNKSSQKIPYRKTT